MSDRDELPADIERDVQCIEDKMRSLLPPGHRVVFDRTPMNPSIALVDIFLFLVIFLAVMAIYAIAAMPSVPARTVYPNPTLTPGSRVTADH